jgi:hypothetical protein
MLWGYNYNASGAPPATGAVRRLLKAEDLEYADMAAQDWVISGSVGLSSAVSKSDGGTLQSELAVRNAMDDAGRYIATWPAGGDVLVDLDGRSMVDIGSVMVGDLAIAPGYRGDLSIWMKSYLNGTEVRGNLCGLYVKFFERHNSSGVDLYRRGGGDGWNEVLRLGPTSSGLGEARLPVAGSYCVYKLVRLEYPQVISVSLRIKLGS